MFFNIDLILKRNIKRYNKKPHYKINTNNHIQNKFEFTRWRYQRNIKFFINKIKY